MGEVYLGEDPYIGRRVAIKIIKGADPEARDRFLHEARVIGGLAHPAIVALLDFDFSGDEPFLVMELLKGQSLDAWIKSPHTLTEQLRILDDVCQALAYAHENGVLHRDIKPSNVQVLPNGHAKLMDFGIARAPSGKLTATGAVMGTPEYMAPEILNDAAYSTRSDLYACGVLLYEMFTGSNPFAGKTMAAALANVLTLSPTDVRVGRPDFPRHLGEILMSCLRKDPAMRPDGFDALIAAAREAAGGPVMASLPETRAIPVGVPGETTALPRSPSAPPSIHSKARAGFWLGGAVVTATIVLILALNRNPGPSLRSRDEAGPTPVPVPVVTPAAKAAGPSPVESPSVLVEATPPTRPTRVVRAESVRESAAPTATPAPTPPFTVSSAPTPALQPPSPNPQPSAAVPVEAVTTPTPQQPRPSPSAGAEPRVFSSQTRNVRRGSSVDIEVRGEGFRRDLFVVVLQGRRPAAGIKVVRQEFVSDALFRVRLLIDAETPLVSYSLVLQDKTGIVTQGVQIEVVL